MGLNRQQIFRAALSREHAKNKKSIDRGEDFRVKFPYGTLFLWILFLGVGIYVLLFSHYLTLNQIIISGSEHISESELRSTLEPLLTGKRFKIFPANNFFITSRRVLQTTFLAQYPLIASVDVKKVFPQTVTFHITERPELLLWCAGGPCAMLDSEGKALFQEHVGEARYAPWRLTIIDTSALPFQRGEILPVADYLNFFAQLRTQFLERLHVTLDQEATTPSRYSRELRVRTSEGWALRVSIDIPLTETLSSVEVFLRERSHNSQKLAPLMSVDVRVPGKLFVTSVGEVAPLPTATPEAQSPQSNDKDKQAEKKH